MDKPELAKYRELYSQCMAAIFEMHNAHSTFVSNPTINSARNARSEINNTVAQLNKLRLASKYVLAEHSCVTKQEHVQQKELARTNKLTKKGK